MPCEFIFVGTYGEKLGHVDGKGKGVYVLRFDTETLRLVWPASMPLLGQPQLDSGMREGWNSTWLTTHRHGDGRLLLYVCDEAYGGEGGSVLAASVDEATAELVALGPPVLVGGTGTCHLAVAPGGRHLLAANYFSGSVSAVEVNADGSLGAKAITLGLPAPGCEALLGGFPRTNAARQEGAHAHMVLFSGPERVGGVRCVLVPDLGSDAVWAVRAAHQPAAAARGPHTDAPSLGPLRNPP
jgi:6-phosphogluconolactonase